MTSIGTKAERDVRDDLMIRCGYVVIRSAGSLGPADLAAIGAMYILFVQVKRIPRWQPGVAAMAPAERRELYDMARRLPNGKAVLALRVKGNTTPVYRLLTGHGPQDWQSFEPSPPMLAAD